MRDVYASRHYGVAGVPPQPVAAMAAAGVAAVPAAHRFFLGRDAAPQALDVQADLPGDPFAQLVLRQGHRPQTLTELLAALGTSLPVRRTFVVGDGSQIPWTAATKDLQRALRLLVTCSSSVSPRRAASAGVLRASRLAS